MKTLIYATPAVKGIIGNIVDLEQCMLVHTLRSSVCAYTLLRRVLIYADCKWPSPTPFTTLPLYEMITCFIYTKLPLGQDFQRNATVFKWG